MKNLDKQSKIEVKQRSIAARERFNDSTIVKTDEMIVKVEEMIDSFAKEEALQEQVFNIVEL